jgi:YidC/Oxa1 family membrane protein insertase
MEQRRVLLAIGLAFLVLYIWQALVVKPVPKPVTGQNAPASSTRAATPGVSTPTTASPTSEAPPAPSTPSKAPLTPDTTVLAASPLVAENAERDVRVETRDVIAVFTNRGARLKSWRLKAYLDAKGQPQELVENSIPGQPLPFTLKTSNASLDSALNGALYAVTGEPATASESSGPIDLRFEYRDSAGVHALKTFHLDPRSFIVTFHPEITEGDRVVTPTIVWGPAVGDVGEVSRYTKKAEGLVFKDGKISRLATKDLATQPIADGDFKYAGVDDNYFLTVALQPGPSSVTFQPVSIPPPGDSKDPSRELVSWAIAPQRPGAIKFFAGPKDFYQLTAIDPDLAKAIDFGYFQVIVVPLLRSLKWVNGFVGNYGWSIIILTLIINIVLFPLRHKSVVSMRKMQEIQPEVKAIQDRYSKLKATDPAKQKMNQELMALYKERGVNPASGCVPMLLTFPFIFAFYALLSTAIELRGAPWFGWIHDLSAHDPYFVVPIAMGVSQIWQQRLAPAAGVDPVQQNMMLFMPVFFTFLFLWYPSGVALYWFVNNIWAIGQQYLTNYMIGPPRLSTSPGGSSASERRMKRVGGGKTEAARDN